MVRIKNGIGVIDEGKLNYRSIPGRLATDPHIMPIYLPILDSESTKTINTINDSLFIQEINGVIYVADHSDGYKEFIPNSMFHGLVIESITMDNSNGEIRFNIVISSYIDFLHDTGLIIYYIAEEE